MSMSARDLQCLHLAAHGRLAKDIAAELGISQRMAEWHLLCARRDLGANNTAEAVYRLLTKRTRKTEVEKQAYVAQVLWHEDGT